MRVSEFGWPSCHNGITCPERYPPPNNGFVSNNTLLVVLSAFLVFIIFSVAVLGDTCGLPHDINHPQMLYEKHLLHTLHHACHQGHVSLTFPRTEARSHLFTSLAVSGKCHTPARVTPDCPEFHVSCYFVKNLSTGTCHDVLPSGKPSIQLRITETQKETYKNGKPNLSKSSDWLTYMWLCLCFDTDL